MNLQQIKDAIAKGETVCWKSNIYHVHHVCGEYYITCLLNQHTIGLTWTDGTTINGKEEDFYILAT